MAAASRLRAGPGRALTPALNRRARGADEVAMARRTTSDPADTLALRFRLRTLRIGMWPSLFTCAYFALYNALTWERPHRDALLALCAVAGVSAVALPTAPVERVVRSRWREPFFLPGARASRHHRPRSRRDGGSTSPLALLFFVPLVFAALSYPLRSVIVDRRARLHRLRRGRRRGRRADPQYVGFFALWLVCVARRCAPGRRATTDRAAQALAACRAPTRSPAA